VNRNTIVTCKIYIDFVSHWQLWRRQLYSVSYSMVQQLPCAKTTDRGRKPLSPCPDHLFSSYLLTFSDLHNMQPNNGLRVFFCSPYTSYIFSISLILSNAYRNKHKCLFSISSILFPHSRKEKRSKDKNVKSSYSYFLTEFFQARWL